MMKYSDIKYSHKVEEYQSLRLLSFWRLDGRHFCVLGGIVIMIVEWERILFYVLAWPEKEEEEAKGVCELSRDLCGDTRKEARDLIDLTSLD
jgi:hypothetical protein